MNKSFYKENWKEKNLSLKLCFFAQLLDQGVMSKTET